ncbi:hypothetical protein [Aurantiacibacter sp. D1-12]|uniref:hypothetical protein n=1 Tax=Aurantiacibacter sp. D1-12 TaxID=2993658 RepID=UPI00237C6C6E|nr:hypothetical protein [Aurantiacibacter sp. D1-12]MDE1468132.1 hypothetical protein [Aurantiacibacter sp. D1-12]
MRDQSEANYRWFKSNLTKLLANHRGEHALLHDESVDEFFATSLEAIMAGMKRYGEGNFSVEPVDDAVEDLGFYSHVSSALRA